jgi:predicted nucleotidyltransferase
LKKLKSILKKDNSNIIEIFQHGSIARGTEVRIEEKGSDFDLIALIKSKDEALIRDIKSKIKNYANSKKYKFRTQKKSFGLILDEAKRIDIVIGVPKEGVSVNQKEQWKNHPIEILSNETESWIESEPFKYQAWVENKNKETDGLFSLSVRLCKLWQLRVVKSRPNGFALENIIAQRFPNNAKKLTESFCKVIESLEKAYTKEVIPSISVFGSGKNLLLKVSQGDWENFYNHIMSARKSIDKTFKKILESNK